MSATYTIYSSHLQDMDYSDGDIAKYAERLQSELEKADLDVEVVVKHGVSGVGAGYAGLDLLGDDREGVTVRDIADRVLMSL